MEASYWQTVEGRVEEAVRRGMRAAGVTGPLAPVVGPVVREVMQLLAEAPNAHAH